MATLTIHPAHFSLSLSLMTFEQTYVRTQTGMRRSGSYGGLFKAAGGSGARHRRHPSDMSACSLASEQWSESDASEHVEGESLDFDSTPDKKTS